MLILLKDHKGDDAVFNTEHIITIEIEQVEKEGLFFGQPPLSKIWLRDSNSLVVIGTVKDIYDMIGMAVLK